MDSGQSEGYNLAVHIAYRNRMITSAKFAKLSVGIFLAACTAVFVTMAANPSAAQTNSSATQQQPGQITGHVYRADNNEPVPRATVSMNQMGGRGITVTASPQTTRTDATGAYTFTTVTPGNYILAAEHAGLINGFFMRGTNGTSPEPVAVAPGETVSKIDVRLLAAAVISGTVLDEDNQPLEGAQVSAVRLRYQKGGQQTEQPLKSVTADDQGNFRLYGLPEGNYFVRVDNRNLGNGSGEAVFRSAYYPGTPTVESAQRLKATAGAETSGVRFAIGTQSTFTISGTVIDNSDSPGQRRYLVSAIRTSEGESIGLSNQATNDSSFAIHGVPSGDYLLTARSLTAPAPIQIAGPNGSVQIAQHINSGTAVVRVSDADARVNIPISGMAEVDGRISIENANGQSISGIRVTLQSQSFGAGLGNATANAGTDQNGAFKIQNVQTGSYLFSVAGRNDMYLKQAACSGRDYTYQPLPIDSAITIADCALTLSMDTAVMTGQVLDSNKPVPDLVVVAVPQSLALRRIARYTLTANTDANGTFKISGMIPGDYLVFAVPKDDEQSYFQIDFADRNQRDAERVSINSGDTKTVTLKPASSQ
ncbi:MAG TPA: carboxypeptidase regulatory-like domain-containing protein [Candidatus Acidoferrales bacterium]